RIQDKVLNDPPYNFVLNTSPNTEARPKRPDQWATLKYDYHWHIDIIPRLVRIAGFEWGSGFYINPSVPEDAAKYLRESRKID
ncbi:MAG: galactose-1-phosphate uridylyltransferase, partial [Candidatus Aminicenantes bacterium]